MRDETPHGTPAGSLPASPRALSMVDRGCGFTLQELLIVLSLIVVLLGLLFPALSVARRSARNAETKTLMNSVSNAMQSFRSEQQRSPGFFSQTAMTANNNGGLTGTTSQGFTQMENAMLELAGGLISEQEFDNSGGANNASQSSLQFRLDIGPANAVETAYVRPGQMFDADNTGSYIALSAGALRPIEINGAFNTSTNYYPLSAKAVNTTNAERTAMNYVMDPFDRPLLLWTADPLARYTVSENDTTLGNQDYFAQEQVEANRRALFYYYSNSGILRMNTIGQRNERMGGGLLRPGGGAVNPGTRAETLEAMLGNPAFRTRGDVTDVPGQPRVMPLRPLGTDMIWAAGADGVFLDAAPSIRGMRFHFDPTSGEVVGNVLTRDQVDDIVIAVP